MMYIFGITYNILVLYLSLDLLCLQSVQAKRYHKINEFDELVLK